MERVDDIVERTYREEHGRILAALVAPDQPRLRDMLEGYYLYHATRADLLRRLGRRAEAAEGYRRALRRCQNTVERRFLLRRLGELGSPSP